MYALIDVKLYDFVTYRDNAYVLFDDDIIEVGEMKDFEPSLVLQEHIINGQGRLLMPGLINFHTHIYSAFARGCDFKAHTHNFTEVLEQIWWKLDRVLKPEHLKMAAIAYGRESIKKGVVGLVDHNASGGILGSTQAIMEGLSELGIHGTTCFEVSDRMNIDFAIEENLNHLKREGGLFGLHASMTLSDATLKACAIAKGKYPVHVHVSESVDDHLAYEKTPLQRLNQYGLIDEDSLLVHGVHLTDEDMDIIKDKGAKLVIAVRSNANNAVGIPNIEKLIQKGVPLLAGSDGLGANMAQCWQDLYYLAKNRSLNLNCIELNDIKAAIVKGYTFYEKWTGLKLGRFAKGYRMDAVLYHYDAYTPMEQGNLFGHVFFGVWDTLDVVHVWVGGKPLIWNRESVKRMPLNPEDSKVIWEQMGR